MKKILQIDWKEKFSMLEKFEDQRMKYFGEKLIFNEAPEILPETTQKNIKKQIKDKLFSMNKEKWLTLPAAENEIDNLRENKQLFSFKSEEEKLNFLEDIDKYYKFLRDKYESA